MKNYSFLVAFLFASILSSQNAPEVYVQKSYTLERIQNDDKIKLDGNFDEASWTSMQWGGGDFTVNQPNNGDAPQRQTKFKIIYDNNYMYIAFLCLDDDPSKIERRMARRDNFPGDWVEVNFDSYADKNTAFSFSISASGVKGDEFITGNGNNWDSSWNPIWYAATKVVDIGWHAEVKIPLSQLRFANVDQHTWGFQMTRRDFRADERSTFQHIPRETSGWVSNFAKLEGINSVKNKRQVEIQPYVVAGLNIDGDAPDGVDKASSISNIGVDGKIGITSDLTLDYTVNPDFGQVEADPSALNIDGFQIFFREQRPFFVENANLFDFSVSRTEAGGPHGNDNLFYSRRIGQSPRGGVEASDTAIIDYPNFTSILGAAKFSGKTQKGLSVGVLESVTGKEYATVKEGNTENTQLVEPLTNYFVGRLSQDINDGASQIGVTLTHVNRSLDNTGLEDLYHKDAMSGGLNLLHTWKDRQWVIKANLIGSRVSGTTNRIHATQTSFEHYYQRPDAKHLEVDTTMTSMVGHGGRFSIANYGGNDNISFETGMTWRSKGLELNDIGFMNTADEINHFFWAGWRAPRPIGIFRSARLNYNHYGKWTTDGENLYNGVNVNAHGGFHNYWSAGMGINLDLHEISTKALFGGPKVRNFNGAFTWMYIETDSRKKVRFNLNAGRFNGFGIDKEGVTNYYVNFGINYQPSNRLRVSVWPNYRATNRVIQNVGLFDFEGLDRYVTGRIDRQTLSVSLRGSYNFSPNLTLEYWGQPFISKGTFSEFKYMTDALAEEWPDRFELYSNNQLSVSENGDVAIDEDLDGKTDYSFDNPDFNFMQWRSNMVMRWEYTPGSEFFFVWSQSTTNFGDPKAGLFESLEEDLFSDSFNNTFLIKWTYRFFRK